MAALFGRQLAVVECVRIEMMDECTERETVAPGRREVGYLNVLRRKNTQTKTLNETVKIQNSNVWTTFAFAIVRFVCKILFTTLDYILRNPNLK